MLAGWLAFLLLLEFSVLIVPNASQLLFFFYQQINYSQVHKYLKSDTVVIILSLYVTTIEIKQSNVASFNLRVLPYCMDCLGITAIFRG